MGDVDGAMLQPHESSSETLVHDPAGRRGWCFNLTRVRLKQGFGDKDLWEREASTSREFV